MITYVLHSAGGMSRGVSGFKQVRSVPVPLVCDVIEAIFNLLFASSVKYIGDSDIFIHMLMHVIYEKQYDKQTHNERLQNDNT